MDLGLAGDKLPACMDGSVRGSDPLALRQVHVLLRLSLCGYGGKQDIVAKHILPAQAIAGLILREIKKHGAHDGTACFGGYVHMLFYIWSQAFAQQDKLL